jgi:two-component system, cell cycle response regulator DivK
VAKAGSHTHSPLAAQMKSLVFRYRLFYIEPPPIENCSSGWKHPSYPHDAAAMRTVLLVDQDPDSLTVYSLFLEHHGYRVLLAQNGDEAFRIAAAQLPDVVITELYIPGIEGQTLSEYLKRDARTAAVPILAVTSFPISSARHASGLAACDGYLAKPCAPSRLLVEVERWVSRSAPQIVASA